MRSPAGFLLKPVLLAVALSAIPPAGGGELQAQSNPSKSAAGPAHAWMRWFEGQWHGSGGNFPSFFEVFRWADDSTMDHLTYPDSTLSRPSESSRFVVRGQELYRTRPGTAGAIVQIRGDSLRFANGSLWVRRSADHWSAILGGGRVTYEMKRQVR